MFPIDRDHRFRTIATNFAEARRDARVAREFEIGLPHELSTEQRLEATRELAQKLANRCKKRPSEDAVAVLKAAIERCETYRAIAERVLFRSGAGTVIDARGLAVRLFDKCVGRGDDVEGAVAWLIRLMTTRETTGLFKAALWGMVVDRDVSFGNRYSSDVI